MKTNIIWRVRGYDFVLHKSDDPLFVDDEWVYELGRGGQVAVQVLSDGYFMPTHWDGETQRSWSDYQYRESALYKAAEIIDSLKKGK